MATELPDKPESREESYLANIAGQDVELPEEPLSRKEQYLNYIAKNGSGGGGGGTSDFDQLSNRPKYNGTVMTGDTDIPEVKDTTYTAGTGLNLSGTEFSVDTETIATQADLTTGLATKQNTLTAGENITIDGDTISASGGQSTLYELSTADYNWPQATPDGIALWLMPSGMYYANNNAMTYIDSSRKVITTGFFLIRQTQSDTDRGFIVEITANSRSVVCGQMLNGGGSTILPFSA